MGINPRCFWQGTIQYTHIHTQIYLLTCVEECGRTYCTHTHTVGEHLKTFTDSNLSLEPTKGFKIVEAVIPLPLRDSELFFKVHIEMSNGVLQCMPKLFMRDVTWETQSKQ